MRGKEREGEGRRGREGWREIGRDGVGGNEYSNCRLYSSCHYLYLPHDHIEV